MGLSDTQGSSQLFLHGGSESPFNSLHATSASGEAAAGGTSSAVSVELNTLNNLLSTIAPQQPPTLLKLDLQGHEACALRGASNVLRACLAVEVEVPMQGALYAETASTREEIFGHLEDAGFRAIAFHTERWFGGNPPDMDVLFMRPQ